MQKVLSSITWDTQQVIIHLLRLKILIVGVPVIVIDIYFQFHKLCFVLLELHITPKRLSFFILPQLFTLPCLVDQQSWYTKMIRG
jgi:hypothetical protein